MNVTQVMLRRIYSEQIDGSKGTRQLRTNQYRLEGSREEAEDFDWTWISLIPFADLAGLTLFETVLPHSQGLIE